MMSMDQWCEGVNMSVKSLQDEINRIAENMNTPTNPGAQRRAGFHNLRFKAPLFDSREKDSAHIFLQRFEIAATSDELSDAQKLNIFPSCLDNRAIGWFATLPNSVKTNYQEVKAAFLCRFNSSDDLEYTRKLEKLYCNSLTYLDEYVNSVEHYGSLLGRQPRQIVEKFISGLPDNVCRWVSGKQPTTMHQAFGLAREGFILFGSQRYGSDRNHSYSRSRSRTPEYHSSYRDASRSSYRDVEYSHEPSSSEEPMEFMSRSSRVKWRDSSRDRNRRRSRSSSINSVRQPLTCFRCGGKGHKEAQCPSPPDIKTRAPTPQGRSHKSASGN